VLFYYHSFYNILSTEICRSKDNEKCYKTQHLRKQTSYSPSMRTEKKTWRLLPYQYKI